MYYRIKDCNRFQVIINPGALLTYMVTWIPPKIRHYTKCGVILLIHSKTSTAQPNVRPACLISWIYHWCIKRVIVIHALWHCLICIHITHYIDVIMTTMASQITSLTAVYSTVYSDAGQRKHQCSASLACVGNSPGPVNFPHKGQVTRKMLSFDDVIMLSVQWIIDRIPLDQLQTRVVVFSWVSLQRIKMEER